jgi:N-acyl-D-amino-acid deacylase
VPTLDIVISGGAVHDGLGSEPLRTDVGVSGDRIADMGDLSRAEARVRLDASGRVVCPGFVDVHSHSDTYLLLEPSAPSKVFQGITTEVAGNCGSSAAPISGAFHLPSDWADKTYPGAWRTVSEYRALLDRAQPAPNVRLLIGHRNLRVAVAGHDNRAVTPDELARMLRLLEQSLDEGGAGLSTGLIYHPAMFATREELVELARVAARHGGIYTSHMRNEGGGLLEAIDEAIAIGRDAGLRVEISHLKTSGAANWPLVDSALDRIRGARDQGLAVAADRYPYTAAGTDLDVILPDWAQQGGHDAVLRRLRSPADRDRMKQDICRSRPETYWETVTVASTSHPENRRFEGQPLVKVAEQLGLSAVDAALRLIETDEMRTTAFFFGMNEENMMRILVEPYVMLGSDASLRSPEGVLSRDHPHPRAYGTFPRFLRWALDGRTVPLPEAIRKATSLPAGHFVLKDRGVLAKGKFADVVVFDPARLHDTADYSAPHRLAEGIEHVIVNGVLTLSAGRFTGRRAGRFLP